MSLTRSMVWLKTNLAVAVSGWAVTPGKELSACRLMGPPENKWGKRRRNLGATILGLRWTASLQVCP